MPRVIVSAGHTDELPGTVVGDLKEVEQSRKIAKQVVSQLRKDGVITLSVPYNLSLNQRIKWINATGYDKGKGDVLVEIHNNKGGKTGVEAWYVNSEDKRSRKLAESLTAGIEQETGLEIQGIKDQKDHKLGEIKVIKQVKPIAALLECLYLDNKSDQQFLKDDNKIKLLGTTIAKAITKYIGVKTKTSKQENLKMRKFDTAKQPKNNSSQVNSRKSNSSNSKNTSNNFGQPSSPPPFSNSFNSPSAGSSSPPANFGGGASSGFQSNKPTMTRDERKEMIKKWYMKAFGKQPEQGDLNYFLNIGITEEQMIKRILDSQDHADMVKNAREYAETKKKYDDLVVKAENLDKKLKDQRVIMEKLNSLLLQKNSALSQMQKRSTYLMSKIEEIQSNKGVQTVKLDYKGNFWERLMDWFSRTLS
jgi:uncharacterized coiled-coil protein SlyX